MKDTFGMFIHVSWKSSGPEMEYFFECPYCWERISIIIDTSVNDQIFIEDCEVCCRPIEIRVVLDNSEVSSFSASKTD